MKLGQIAFVLGVCWFSFSAAAQDSEPQNFHNPVILTYHDIVLEKIPGTESEFDVLVDEFDTQMDYLKREGYQTLSLEDYYRFRTGKKQISAKSVLITFDDGYFGQIEHAVPKLRKLKFKAAFFIHTGFVDGPRFDSVPASRMHGSWEDWKKIDRDRLFSVESHTMSHRSLKRAVGLAPGAPDPTLNDVHLDAELRSSQQTLELILGKKKEFLAYPSGDHDTRTIQFTKRFYKMAFAFGDPDEKIDPLYQVPRVKMLRSMRGDGAFATTLNDWQHGAHR